MYSEPEENAPAWDSDDFYAGFDPHEDRDLFHNPEGDD